MIRHRKDLSSLYVAHIGQGIHEDIVAKCMAVYQPILQTGNKSSKHAVNYLNIALNFP